MRKRVSSIRRPVASLDLALAAFREARYQDALDHLRGLPASMNSLALKLRVFLRLSKLDEGKVLIARHGASLAAESSDGEYAVFCALAGRVFEVARNDDIAREWYTKAYEHSLTCDDVDLVAEVHYFLALSAYSARDRERLDGHVHEVMQSRQPWLRALGQSVRAFMSVAEADYDTALNAYEAALLLFATESEARDRAVESGCLRQYVALIYVKNAASFALAALSYYDEFPWTAELAETRFSIAYDLADLFSIWGDDMRAYRLLREAEASAPNDAALLLVRSFRSAQALHDGEEKFAVNELDAATSIYSTIDWPAARPEYRMVLLEYAVAAAPLNLSAARAALDTYGSLAPLESATHFTRSDPRFGLMESFAEGAVAKSAGDSARAALHFEAAVQKARFIGHKLREQRAIVALAQVTGAGIETHGMTSSRQRDVVELFVPKSQHTTR